MRREYFGDKKAFGKVAKQGVAWGFLREGVSEVLLFPFSMIIARLLTPEEFGISTAALFFIQLSARLGDLGLNVALVRSKVLTAAHESTVFVVNVFMGILAYGILVSIAPLIGTFYGVPEAGAIIPVAALSFLIAPFGTVPGALLTRDMRFRESSFVDWYHGTTFAVLSTVLAWMGFSFWSLVYARVASVAVQACVRTYFARWRPSLTFRWEVLREVLGFGVGMQAKRMLEYTAGNIDNVIVGRLMGMTALGMYDKAFSTMNRFLGRMNSGGPTVMFRIFSLIHEDPERFRRAYSRAIMSVSLLGFPLFAVLIVTAPQVMVVLFGPVWRPAAEPFRILCIAAILRVLDSYASSATMAAGRIWSEVWRQSAYVVLMIAGLVVLRDWGPAGAAMGVLIATIVRSVLMHLLLKRVTQLSWSEILRPLTPALLCSAGFVAVVLLVEYALRAMLAAPGDWLLLACQAISGAVFYGIFLLFAPHAELRDLVHETTSDLAPAFLMRQRWLQWYLQASVGGRPART